MQDELTQIKWPKQPCTKNTRVQRQQLKSAENPQKVNAGHAISIKGANQSCTKYAGYDFLNQDVRSTPQKTNAGYTDLN